MVRSFGKLGLALLAWSGFVFAGTRIINGSPVPAGTYGEVVKIKTAGQGCTATIVGKRAIVSAAHCAADGANITFDAGGATYTAKFIRSSLYPKQDHDIAVGVVDKDIVGVDPASIGGAYSNGLIVTLLGFGCTQSGGGGTSGSLTMGTTILTGSADLDMISNKSGGAALCFGDSGGPAFVTEGTKRLLLGVNSKGNIVDTNYHARTDIKETKDFLTSVATQNGIQICGINQDCNGVTPPAPTCTMSANPSTIDVGKSATVTLVANGNVTSAAMDGASVTLVGGKADKVFQGIVVGVKTVSGSVTGPGGTGSCSASFTVKDPGTPGAPTCTISVSPTTVTLGGNVLATIQGSSDAKTATIDGNPVSPNGGTFSIKAASPGVKTARGVVTNDNGTGSCTANYTVQGDQPPITNFDVVRTHCGQNTMMQTDVREVCVGMITYSWRNRDLTLKDVLTVTYADGTKEILPILLRQLGRGHTRAEAEIYEELTFYANSFDEIDGKTKLRVTKGLLKTSPQGEPLYVQGHSAQQQFFMVPNLKKLP